MGVADNYSIHRENPAAPSANPEDFTVNLPYSISSSSVLVVLLIRLDTGALSSASWSFVSSSSITVTNDTGVAVTALVSRHTGLAQNFDPTNQRGLDLSALGSVLDDIVRALQEVYDDDRILRSVDPFEVASKVVRAGKYFRFDENGDPEFADGALSYEQQAFLDELDDYAISKLVNVQSDWTEDDANSDAHILNVPATFPPSAHTHSWADIVSGIPLEFPPLAHTHLWADITDTNSANAVFQTIMANDYVHAGTSLRMGNTGRARFQSFTTDDADDSVRLDLSDGAGPVTRWAWTETVFTHTGVGTGSIGTEALPLLQMVANSMKGRNELSLGSTGRARFRPTDDGESTGADSRIIIDLSNGVGPEAQYVLDALSFSPVDDDTISLGTAATWWKSSYISSMNTDQISFGSALNTRVRVVTESGGSYVDNDLVFDFNGLGGAVAGYNMRLNTFAPAAGNVNPSLGLETSPWGNLWCQNGHFAGNVTLDGNILNLNSTLSIGDQDDIITFLGKMAGLKIVGGFDITQPAPESVSPAGMYINTQGAEASFWLQDGFDQARIKWSTGDALVIEVNQVDVFSIDESLAEFNVPVHFMGTVSSTETGSARVSPGVEAGTPRIWMEDPASTAGNRVYGLDVYLDSLRWFKPGALLMSLDANGLTIEQDLSVKGTLARFKSEIIRLTGTNNLTAADSGKKFILANGAIANLPSVVVGLDFEFRTENGATAVLNAGSGDSIRIAGDDAQSYESDSGNAWVQLRGTDSSNWDDWGNTGTWAEL